MCTHKRDKNKEKEIGFSDDVEEWVLWSVEIKRDYFLFNVYLIRVDLMFFLFLK